jgi:hypothetical protein
MPENPGGSGGTIPPIEEGGEMAVAAPTYPSGMTGDKLLIANLMPIMPGDVVYFGIGKYSTATEADTAFASGAVATTLNSNYDPLGELAEKAGKLDSKQAKVKSRNYSFPGKRTTTVELNIVGLSCAQKDYLESGSFTGREITIVVGSADNTRLVVLNGLYWTVDITGESDGLFQVTVSADFSGPTTDRIYLYRSFVRGE